MDELNKNISATEKIEKKMPLYKKILWGVLILVVIFVIVQFTNASKYKMTVMVVEGENVLGVNPTTEKLDFGDLSRNNGMIRRINIVNGGSLKTRVIVFKFGEVSELIKLNKNFFVLNPGDKFELTFDINIPASAEFREYKGNVWIFRLPKIF